ncbi:MAG: hypothetical protein IPL74_07975 [Bacteroidetes bacterium]|nr:hypothetical protein [Bacteroidota bacterium]
MVAQTSLKLHSVQMVGLDLKSINSYFCEWSSAANLWSTTEPSNTLGAWFKDMGANFGVGFPGEMVHGSVGTDIYAFEWKNAVGSSFSNTTTNLINFQIVLYGPASSNPGR